MAGSKKLKAVAVVRGKRAVPCRDPQLVSRLAKQIYEDSTQDVVLCEWGTAGLYSVAHRDGWLPVKNYTTNIFPEHEVLSGQHLRSHFEVKPKPCWACRIAHCRSIRVTEGPCKGYEGEEPEYEGMAAMGSLIGQTDPGAAVMLGNLADRLGMDINETGWVIAWVMECYEKGLLADEDTDGLRMTWGNAEAVREMLRKIAYRDGFGAILAEGVKRGAEHIGGQALDLAIYTKKGASPRSHDHRAWWHEMLDTCVGNTGTIEATGGHRAPEQLGLPPLTDLFSPEEVSWMNAKLNGRRQFEDSLGYCRFCVLDLRLAVEALNAVTGWDFDIEEAMDVGRRTVNLLRAFNITHGLTWDLETPSSRYASTPVDGPMSGKSIMPFWDDMVRNYYRTMGWDSETGKPLPTTLKRLGLENIVKDIWG